MLVAVKVDRHKNFFDRQAVIAAVGRANARNLAKAGGLIRTIGRRSLRRRKKPSAPGTPPSVHANHPFATLKNILFGLDADSKSVVVGPVKFSRQRKRGVIAMNQTVPNLHEKGGTAVRVREVLAQVNGRKAVPPAQAAAFRKKIQSGEIVVAAKAKVLREEVIRYAPRPFMKPALNTALPKIAPLWRNSVKA